MADRERQRRFATLLREHRGIVFKVTRMYARDQHDRDDLAQEIAAQLWRSFPAYDPGCAKFTTWMYRVALNVAISHARGVERSCAKRVESLGEAHLDTLASADAPHDESMQRDERIAALYAFIARLDALNRALVLLYLDDHSYAEIAEVLGISETNVATKLGRIKQKMRAGMGVAKTEGVKNGTR
jgi:RNA polymerase sigma-70 factor (ECF subfamily)